MIRVQDFRMDDLPAIQKIHQANGLPSNCLPDLDNPLFFLRKVVDDGGTICLASFLKLTAEAFLFVDHEHESPEWRWAALQKLTAATLHEASVKGVDSVSAWLPPPLEKSFAPRLVDLGWQRSPWPSYSVNLG